MASLLGIVFQTPVRADVIWEDFQGNNRIAGTSNQDLPGPSFANGSGTSLDRIAALRSISANPTNASRTGTSADIDYLTSSQTLCNLDVDTAGTGAACQADAQGRVIYAVLKLPYAGNYTFGLTHDDDIDLDLSTDYTSAAFRTASYSIPIGPASEYTLNDTVYEPLTGTVYAPSDNSCVLLRLYWNNVGGNNHLRLRWVRPLFSGATILTTTEMIPAAQYMTPGTTTGCTGAGTAPSNWSLTVNKSLNGTGRAGAADQFVVGIEETLTGTRIASATTGGSGNGAQASTGATFLVANTTYRITDTMASGSQFALSAYSPSISCTLNGSAFSPAPVSAGVWSLTTPLIGTSQQYICTVTNTRASRQLQLRKAWVGAVVGHAVTIPPTSGFSTNTVALAAVANNSDEIDTGSAVTVLTGTGTLPAESFTVGNSAQYGAVLSCSDGTLSGTNARSTNQLTIPASGAMVICTYTNSFYAPLTLAKISTPYWDPANGTTNPKLIPGALVDYIVSVTSPNSYAANSVIVFDSLPNQVALYVNDVGASPAGPLAFTAGTSGLTYNFAGFASLTDDIDFSNDNGATWTYVPQPDGDGIDTAITNIRVNPKGNMVAGSNFTLRIRAKIK